MPFERLSPKGLPYPFMPDDPVLAQELTELVAVTDGYILEQWGSDLVLTGGLTYAYKGGVVFTGGIFSRVADGTVTLVASTVNYIERTAAGIVVVNQTAFTVTNLPMAKATTDVAGITALEDWRVIETPAGGAVGAHVFADTTGLGPSHTTSGLVAGQVLRATAPTTAAFQRITHADVDSGPLTATTGTFSGGVTATGNIQTDSRYAVGSIGTNSNPSIYLVSDTNTGIRWPVADTLTLVVGGAEAVRVVPLGNVLIGTETPATGGPRLDVVASADLPQVVLADNITNATLKIASIGVRHFTNIEEPTAGLQMVSNTSTAVLRLGGGSAGMNAVTSIEFYTAANNTTLTGTLQLSISSAGLADFQSNNVQGISTLTVANLILTGAAYSAGEVLMMFDPTTVVGISGTIGQVLTWTAAGPGAEFAAASAHQHAASDITTGTFAAGDFTFQANLNIGGNLIASAAIPVDFQGTDTTNESGLLVKGRAANAGGALTIAGIMLRLQAYGHDSAGYQLGGEIEFEAETAWTTINHSTRINFKTSTSASLPTTRLSISDVGAADFQGNTVTMGALSATTGAFTGLVRTNNNANFGQFNAAGTSTFGWSLFTDDRLYIGRRLGGTGSLVGLVFRTGADVNQLTIDTAGTADFQNNNVSGVLTLTATSLTGTLLTVIQNNVTTMTGLMSVGALNSGSIVAAFGSINIGSSTFTTTGLAAIGDLDLTGAAYSIGETLVMIDATGVAGIAGTEGQVLTYLSGSSQFAAANLHTHSAADITPGVFQSGGGYTFNTAVTFGAGLLTTGTAVAIDATAAVQMTWQGTDTTNESGLILRGRAANAGGAITTGGILLRLQGYGHDGTAYVAGGEIEFESTAVWSGTNHSTQINFKTTSTGAAPTIRWSIDPSGNLFPPAAHNIASSGSRVGTLFAHNIDVADNATLGISAADLLTVNAVAVFNAQAYSPLNVISTKTGTFTPNWDNGNVQKIQVGATNLTVAIEGAGNNMNDGGVYTLIIGGGAGTLSITGVEWGDNGAPGSPISTEAIIITVVRAGNGFTHGFIAGEGYPDPT